MPSLFPYGYIREAQPRYLDNGFLQEGSLGAEASRIDRLGNKWEVDFTTIPMTYAQALIVLARIIRGKKEKLRIRFPQPGTNVAGGIANVAVYSGGLANSNTMVIDENYAAMTEGMFVSHYRVANGQMYLYQLTGNATPHASAPTARCQFSVQPDFRAPVVNGDTLFFWLGTQIDGYVTGQDVTWTVDDNKKYSLGFTVRESA